MIQSIYKSRYDIESKWENAIKHRILKTYHQNIYTDSQDIFDELWVTDFQEEIFFMLNDPISVWVRQ